MLSSDARVVRGLSIANIILSSLAIVGAVITLAFTVLTVVALNDPSVIGAVEGSLSASDLNELRSYGMSEDEMLSVTGGLIGIFGGFFGVWLLISGVVTLIAGIIDRLDHHHRAVHRGRRVPEQAEESCGIPLWAGRHVRSNFPLRPSADIQPAAALRSGCCLWASRRIRPAHPPATLRPNPAAARTVRTAPTPAA